MKSMYVRVAAFIMMVSLLSACGSQSTSTPTAAAQPTEQILPATTEAAQATEPATATQPAAQGAAISFTNEVLPILQSRCVNCHGGDRMEKQLNLKTYADMMAGSENGPVVTLGNAADSKLVELIANQKMPKRGPKLTPPQVQLITEWVNQ